MLSIRVWKTEIDLTISPHPWIRIEERRSALTRDGNGAGPKAGVFIPAPHDFVLPHPCLPYKTGKVSLPHPCPLRPRKALSHSVKLYFLLICPTISTIFLMKHISLIKIYLKLQLNLSHQIKSIFRKNWIIYLSV